MIGFKPLHHEGDYDCAEHCDGPHYPPIICGTPGCGGQHATQYCPDVSRPYADDPDHVEHGGEHYGESYFF